MQADDAFERVGEVAAPLGLALGEGLMLAIVGCGQMVTPASSEPKNLRLLTMPPTEMPPKPTP